MNATAKILTLADKRGCTQSIIIPNDELQTVKDSIEKLNGTGYLHSFCSKFTYNNGFGSYFDKVKWGNILIEVVDIIVFDGK